MRIFDYFFNRYGIPLLVVGSTGTGIKLYFGNVGYFTSGDSPIFYSLEEADPSKDLISVPEEPDKLQPQEPLQVPDNKEAIVSPPAPIVVEPLKPSVPKIITFSDKISEAGFRLVTENTTDDVIKNVMFQRLYPNKDAGFSYNPNQLFTGSIRFTFQSKIFKSRDGRKQLNTIQKPNNALVASFRKSCLDALKIEYKDDTSGKNQLSRLREWCTEPRVKDVLGRHKFQVFSDNRYKGKVDDSIKKILVGWFKKEGKHKWWEKQSFFTPEEVKKILNKKENIGIKSEREVTQDQIKIVKDKCLKELEKNFERENFYLTKDFVDDMSSKLVPKPKVDLFQEVAMFCSVPTTAKDYVTNAMQGVLKTSFDQKIKKDYCYVSNKQPTHYAQVSTTDPFHGRTFWCAVKLLYAPKPAPKKA
ncbi:hypothetical protein MHSWG343_08900 [Candidatus Mycoplasma haematohominis]|uniref:Uncharacterized protein n=1 Tax=Candidatus Mycoplasma haematohominis TaxID=1494318 RepID=A0A478FQX1_9MOLU|nr:hypothetical protein MHSWG343_08900 [Candidatus Mycoplasma haemohominis]